MEGPATIERAAKNWGLRVAVGISLGINAILVLALVLLLVNSDVQDAFAEQAAIADKKTVEDLASAVGETSVALGTVGTLSDRVANLERTVGEQGFGGGFGDTLVTRIDALEEWQLFVCRWARDQTTAWIGTNLYYTFSALRRPFRCPLF